MSAIHASLPADALQNSASALQNELQDAADAASASAAAARDSLKTADLHHRFVKDIRKQVEAEYKAAVDAEGEAAADLGRKRRHAADMEAINKRLRSDAFRSLVKAKGGATCGLGLLSSPASIRRQSQRSLDADYEIEDGEVLFFSPTYTVYTPTSPASPRSVYGMFPRE
jgi:hypothetical protein